MGDPTDSARDRSVWQVLVLYLGGAFVALQVIEQIVESTGLPNWVRGYFLVFLVLGLPVVLLTAAIQGRRVSASRRWFTWRNTALAGLGGLLLIALATATYLVMRAAGIGPAGTLAAQGSIEEGARVVLADFESADTDLGSVVTNTLRIDLLRSPFLVVLEPSQLADGLERMERAADAPITSEVARELAVRDGYDAVIEGEVGAAGDGYVLTARIVGGDDWTSLAAFRSTARSADDLIDAIEELSRDIRDKSGESLRSARGGRPLRAVTTGSLEALKAYDRGIEAWMVGSLTEAREWYRRAIEIDPEFAMAYRRLGAIAPSRGEQVETLTRAFELRDRLTELERLLTEASYYRSVAGDLPAAARAYERMIELAPHADITRNARNNLAAMLANMGHYAEAEPLIADLLAERPYQVGVNTLTQLRVLLGDVEGAWAALQDGSDALPEADYQFANRRVSLAVAIDDLPLARDLAAAFAERYAGPRDVWRRSNHAYLIGASEGRLEAAAEMVDAIGTHPVNRARRRAFLMATRGDSAGAVEVLLEGMAASREGRPAADRLYEWLLPDLIRFGGLRESGAIIAEWDREVPVDTDPVWGQVARFEVEAEAAYARGRIPESIAAWESYEEACPTCSPAASYGLARAFEAAGERDRAIAEYERSLEPGNQYDVDPFFRSDVLRRLARLHEEAGNREQAASYYERIVDRWSEADPGLQPQVEAARARLAGLR